MPTRPSATPSAAESTSAQKVCCQCGVSLAGQKRYKDLEARYWCEPCTIADKARKGRGQVCPDCQRITPPARLQLHEGGYVCRDCLATRQAVAKATKRHIAKAGQQQREERGRFYQVLALVLAVVVCLLLIYWFAQAG